MGGDSSTRSHENLQNNQEKLWNGWEEVSLLIGAWRWWGIWTSRRLLGNWEHDGWIQESVFWSASVDQNIWISIEICMLKHGWNPPVPSVHLAPFGTAKVEVPTSHTGQRLERMQKMASPPNNCQRWQRIMTMLYYITSTILLHFIYVRRYFRFPRDWLKHANTC